MTVTLEDRLVIHELIGLHGHLMDTGAFDRLDELFVADVIYNLEDFGLGELHGIDAVRQAAVALGDGNPIGHHSTNIIVTAVDGDSAHVYSKGIGIRADGSSGTVVYNDVVKREAQGWRIAQRTVIARRTPLHS